MNPEIKVGDIVRIFDGSFCVELINGEWRYNQCPSIEYRRDRETWKVLALNGDLPTDNINFRYGSPIPKNTMLVSLVGDDNHLLCTHPRFVKKCVDCDEIRAVDNKVRTGENSGSSSFVENKCVTEELKERICVLEAEVKGLIKLVNGFISLMGIYYDC
jgi:hypothetical protein